MEVKNMILAGASGIFIIFMLTYFYFSISVNYGIYQNNTANISLERYEDKMENFETQADNFQSIFSNKTSLIEKGYLVISGVFSSVYNIFDMSIGSIQLIFETLTGLLPSRAVIMTVGFITSIIIILIIISLWDWVRGLVRGGG